jgi:hypothetical protein
VLWDVIDWRGSTCGKSSKVENRDDVVEDSVMREINVTTRGRVIHEREEVAIDYIAGLHRVIEREMNVVMPRAVRRRVEFGKTSWEKYKSLAHVFPDCAPRSL